MTGTIIVVSICSDSMGMITNSGSNTGIDTDVAPLAGIPSIPSYDRGVKHR